MNSHTRHSKSWLILIKNVIEFEYIYMYVCKDDQVRPSQRRSVWDKKKIVSPWHSTRFRTHSHTQLFEYSPHDATKNASTCVCRMREGAQA